MQKSEARAAAPAVAAAYRILNAGRADIDFQQSDVAGMRIDHVRASELAAVYEAAQASRESGA